MLCYENLRFEGAFSGVTIWELSIDVCYNDHAYMTVYGMFPSFDKDKYLTNNLEDEIVTLISVTEENCEKVLFCGVILEINILHRGDVYTVSIEAVSMTYLLDICKESMSYQNSSLTFYDVIETELLEKKVTYASCCNDLNDIIKDFLIKYEETKWTFIKRLVSWRKLGLIPDITQNIPAFQIGLPVNQIVHKLNGIPEQVKQNLRTNAECVENSLIKDIPSEDLKQNILNNRTEKFDIGDNIEINGIINRVYKIHAILDKRDAIVRFSYTLATEKGFQQSLLFNKDIRGMCINGRVIDRKKDFSKVHLFSIDKIQEVDDATWFKVASHYCAGTDQGWCAMPELDDVLTLYFPTEKESDCFLRETVPALFTSSLTAKVNTLHKAAKNPYMPTAGDNKTEGSIPADKYLDAPNGQKMLANDKFIHFSSKGNFSTISLTSEKRDLVGTTLGLKLKTDGDINVVGKNIKLGSNATETLSISSNNIILVCDESSIVLDESTGNTDFFSTEISW